MPIATARKAHFVQGAKHPLALDATTSPPVPCDVKLGDVVTFTNDFGVAFSDLKVTGFTPCVVGHVALASFHTGILYPNVTVLGRPGAEVWMIVGSSRGRKIAEFAVHEGKAHALVC